MKRIYRRILMFAFFLFILTGNAFADSQSAIENDTMPHRKTFFQSVVKTIDNIISSVNDVDTNYIEPQHYKFQAMLMNTNTFERYTVSDDQSHKLTIAPDVHSKIGPYVGYSLLFLGYNIQLNHLYVGNNKKEFNLSLYTSLITIDLFSRTNKDYKIRDIFVGKQIDDVASLETNLNNTEVSSLGLNVYYVFNHRKHSYPAAYNQSTCQKRSAGSPLVGIGYSKHNVKVDWHEVNSALEKADVPEYNLFDAESMLNNVDYSCYSLFGGYAYNWVPAKRWLVGSSLSLALGYNRTVGELIRFNHLFSDMKTTNFSIDGVGRLGIVWNNGRIFAGASAVVHSYSYYRDNFSANNIFGNVITYVGFNFGKKAKYRASGKFFEF